MSDKNKLLLIDGHSIMHRAFYGIPDLTTAEGIHTNAVYGFLNIMFKLMETEKPQYLSVAFDLSAPTFRHKMYDEYKGTRKPMPQELREQIPMMKELLEAMQIPIVSLEGYEADDLLGTLGRRGEEEGFEVTIVSGDRDLLQLATDHVKISIPKTKKTGTEIEEYYAADVKERYLVTPKEFIDVKALWGDTADNIPGVPQIGEKTATNIISVYHSIENAHEHASELKPPRAAKNIVEYWDSAVLSKELAAINTEAPIDFDFADAKIEDLFTPEAYVLCKQWELKNILTRFEAPREENPLTESFREITELTEAEEVFDTLRKSKADHIGAAVYLEGHTAAEAGTIRGIGISDGESASFIPAQGFIPAGYLKEQLQSLADAGKKLAFMDVKPVLSQLSFQQRTDAFDVTVAAYLLNPLPNEYTAEGIAKDYLSMMIPGYADLFGKKKEKQIWEEMPAELCTYACYEAYVAAKAPAVLMKQLAEEEMDHLYYDIELPLVYTLYDMETEGISIDGDALKEYGDKLVSRIDELENEIYEDAGEKFNINSPKQLGEVLFVNLNLPGGKKTKTGYSTAADVLDKLAPHYPIVSKILEYRQLTKLKSTYADGLGNCIAADGKIHTTFQQTVTATGRLSSTDPNLQNIPIRMALGKEIRKVFFPKEGCVFLDSDYSQIELRVLAHMSGDENLINAYKNGQDIHRSTASLVFHTPFEEVTDLQRSNAKAVNFGIVYGISAFGLSQDLNISRAEAQQYIDDYFAAYPKLHAYLNRLVEEGKENGYVPTLFGRRRPIPELSSSNFMQRQFGERVAMNSPIQGTAADIIKIAMIRVHDRLAKENLASKLILQVHDELLIETVKSEEDQVRKILEEEMMHAADLAVDLEIDTHAGDNWYNAK